MKIDWRLLGDYTSWFLYWLSGLMVGAGLLSLCFYLEPCGNAVHYWGGLVLFFVGCIYWWRGSGELTREVYGS